MSLSFRLTLIALFSLTLGSDVAIAQSPCPSPVPYGNNAAAGHYVTVNGVRLYYESYGKGPALLIMHGNDGSIVSMSCQIAYFARNHQVIAVDTRGRGKSDDGNERFTFEQQADDFAKLLDRIGIAKADLLGHSDGGIIALEMGMHHPAKVNRIVAASPNLRPDGLVMELLTNMQQGLAYVKAKIATNDKSENWNRLKLQIEQDLDEPNIAPKELHAIQAPVLLVSAAQDLIKPEHIQEIFHNLPQAQLLIVPDTIHQTVPTAPRFNAEAARFLDGVRAP